MDLTIFADGSKQVGLGHLTRMRTLVIRLGRTARVLTTTPAAAARVFTGTDAEIVPLNAVATLPGEIIKHSRGTSVLVLDPPYLPVEPNTCSGPSWQPVADLAREQGIAVVRFTDEETASMHRCDVLVNDHPLSVGYSADYGDAGCVLAGPQYFLIDPSHEQAAAENGGIVVSFGGTDHNDIIHPMARVLAEISETVPVHVVLGEISEIDVGDLPGLTVSKGLPPMQFAGKIKGARLALTASGNTLFERVFHGVPGLSLAQFPRQDMTGREFEKIGLTRHLGLGADLDPGSLKKEILGLLENSEAMAAQVRACRKLAIDKGVRDIISVIDRLATENREACA